MHDALARVLGRLERWPEAPVYFQLAYELLPNCEACAKVAHAYARADDVASSSAWIAEADSLCRASADLGGVGAFMLGQAYALDERMPSAVELFRLARTRGVASEAFLALAEDPELASLGNEPSFLELTEEIPRRSESDGEHTD